MHMEPHHSSTVNNLLATVPPDLPPELECLIFEMAAFDIGPKGSTTLLLVAKRIYNWWVCILLRQKYQKGYELKICRIRPFIFRVFNRMARPPFPDFKSIGHLYEALLVGYNPDPFQHSAARNAIIILPKRRGSCDMGRPNKIHSPRYE